MAKSSKSSGKPLILKFDVDDKGTLKLWQIDSALKKLTQEFGKTGTAASGYDRLQNKMSRSLTLLTSGIRNTIMVMPGLFVLQRTLAYTTDKVIDLINTGSNAEVMERKFRTVFKGMGDEAEEWAGRLSQSMGRSKYEIERGMANIQDLLVPLGFGRREAMTMGQGLLQTAIDIGAFSGVETPQVMADFQSGLVGSTESLRKYGIVVNENRIRQEAMTLGITRTARELTAMEKAQATASLIVKGSADALGAAERNADLYSGKVTSLRSILTDFKTDLGKDLLGPAGGIVDSLIQSMNDPQSKARLRMALLEFAVDFGNGLSGAFRAAAPLLDLGLNVVNSTINALNALPDDVRSWGLIGVALFGRSMSGLLLTHPAGWAAAAAIAIGGPLGKALGTPDYDKQIADRQREVDSYRDQIRQSVDINYLRDTEEWYARVAPQMNMGGPVEDYLLKAPKDLLDGLKEAKKNLDSVQYEKQQFLEIEEKIKKTQTIKPFGTLSGSIDSGMKQFRSDVERQKAELEDLLKTLDLPAAGAGSSITAAEQNRIDLYQAAMRAERDLADRQEVAQLRVKEIEDRREVTGMRIRAGLLDEATALEEQRAARQNLLDLDVELIDQQMVTARYMENEQTAADRLAELERKRTEAVNARDIHQEFVEMERIVAAEERRLRLIEQQNQMARESMQTRILGSQLRRDMQGYFGGMIPDGAAGALTQGVYDFMDKESRYRDMQLSINQAIQERQELLRKEQHLVKTLAPELDDLLVRMHSITESQQQINLLEKQSKKFQSMESLIKSGAALESLAGTFDGLSTAMSTFFGEGSAQAKAFARLSIVVNTAAAIVNTITAWTAFATMNPTWTPLAWTMGIAQTGMIAALGAAQLAQVDSANSTYHTGGMVTAAGRRDVPILAQEGEIVLSRDASAKLLSARGGSNEPVVVGVFLDEDSMMQFFNTTRGRKVIARASGRK